jgi:hypothetical protein
MGRYYTYYQQMATNTHMQHAYTTHIPFEVDGSLRQCVIGGQQLQEAVQGLLGEVRGQVVLGWLMLLLLLIRRG